MYEHHKKSIENMIAHYRENPEITALFLIGSVATGTARPDSDIDAAAVIPPEAVERKKRGEGLEEVCHGKCTYEGGYFNIHYMARENLTALAESGSEPMRNMFRRARPLFCHEPGLPALVEKIPVFQRSEAAGKQFRFYCTFKMYHTYFWRACKPEGFMRLHVADGMIFCLYRLLLLENEILFPSMRKLEEAVALAPSKPHGIIELCGRFMQTLRDEDCAALVAAYESWTAYDYPKEHRVVMNNFADPWEWQ